MSPCTASVAPTQGSSPPHRPPRVPHRVSGGLVRPPDPSSHSTPFPGPSHQVSRMTPWCHNLCYPVQPPGSLCPRSPLSNVPAQLRLGGPHRRPGHACPGNLARSAVAVDRCGWGPSHPASILASLLGSGPECLAPCLTHTKKIPSFPPNTYSFPHPQPKLGITPELLCSRHYCPRIHGPRGPRLPDPSASAPGPAPSPRPWGLLAGFSVATWAAYNGQRKRLET